VKRFARDEIHALSAFVNHDAMSRQHNSSMGDVTQRCSNRGRVVF